MLIRDYDTRLQAGLRHVAPQAEESVEQELALLAEGRGSRRGCLVNLVVTVKAKALVCWFERRDLGAFKQWCFSAAKIKRMIHQIEPGAWFPAYDHLYALLSDSQDMVDWYRQNRVSYLLGEEQQDADNPRQPAFHGYQALLALNSEWDLLKQRCEKILSMNLGNDRKYLVDHRFYLALAQGDKCGMESALNELTTPKVARVRNFEPAFGLTENLIATHATIYAKIAWRHGYEVEVDSPWVPREWLPIRPLEEYIDPWPFMKHFDLYQPFEGPWAPWSPVLLKNSSGET